MKANELMIGDWVVYSGDAEYTNPVRIEGMDILTCALITEDREDVGFDGIEPIPLTAEILEKNGFEMEDNCNYWFSDEDEGLEITFFPKRKNYTNGTYNYVDIYKGCLSIIELPIRFVHELQHALRLCGIEKEIEL